MKQTGGRTDRFIFHVANLTLKMEHTKNSFEVAHEVLLFRKAGAVEDFVLFKPFSSTEHKVLSYSTFTFNVHCLPVLGEGGFILYSIGCK
jgi:hypothetical protein